MDWKSTPPPPLTQSNLESKISPTILLIIVILSLIFFASGLLHLLARYLLRATANNDEEDMGGGGATVFQGQLRQLFHLHDAGVDQCFIDTLPLFSYKAIMGLKEPFDCAVCLCEFEPDDKLRLLPNCSHAFHLYCIDTWLLSHSTCPLCRRTLLPDHDHSPTRSPVVLVLESGSEGSEADSVVLDNPPKTGEIEVKHEKVVHVKLGKIRNIVDGEGTSSSNSSTSKLSERRCFSMGSFDYVMDETSLLQVAIKPPEKKCDCHSRREGFKGFDRPRITNLHNRETFSFSKIWLRSKRVNRPADDRHSGRAFSFRLPLYRGANEESKADCGSSRRTMSEFDAAGWVKPGSEFGSEAEVGSCNYGEEAPSFARNTLLWLVGRQSKVVDHV